MNDYIIKGIHLADGWTIDPDGRVSTVEFGALAHPIESNILLHALVFQLIRQIDAADDAWFETNGFGQAFIGTDGLGPDFYADQADRITNSLKVIIDSGVLEET